MNTDSAKPHKRPFAQRRGLHVHLAWACAVALVDYFLGHGYAWVLIFGLVVGMIGAYYERFDR